MKQGISKRPVWRLLLATFQFARFRNNVLLMENLLRFSTQRSCSRLTPSCFEYRLRVHRAFAIFPVTRSQQFDPATRVSKRPNRFRCTIESTWLPFSFPTLTFLENDRNARASPPPIPVHCSLESSYTEITPNRIADRMSRATEASLSGRRLERSRNAVRMRAGDIRLPLPPPPSPSAADFSASPSSLTCVLLCATATTVHTLFHGLPVDAVYLGSGTFDRWLRFENFTPNQHHWKLSLFFVKFRIVLFCALLLPFQFLFHHVNAPSLLGHVLHDQRGDGIYPKAIPSMLIISYLSMRSRLWQRASISSRIKYRWIVLAYPRTNGTLRRLAKSELDPTLPRQHTRLHLHVSSHAFSFIWPHVAMAIDTRVSVTVPHRFV